MKILFVDDDQNILEYFKLELADSDAELLLASNGEDAYYKYHTQNPDIVLTDAKMDRFDGIELIKKIRNRDSFTPIILFTGYLKYQGEMEGLNVNKFITKPFTTKQIKNSIYQNMHYNKVLIVDTDQYFLGYLGRMFFDQKYPIFTASTATDAIAKFKKFRPNVLIIDADFPLYHNLSIEKIISNASPNLPIIIISEKDQKINDQNIKNPISYLSKPVSFTEIRETIDRYITPRT